MFAPLACWLRGPSVPLPTPWHNRPSSLEYDVLQIFWYLVYFRSCLYSRDCPVSSSITGISQSRKNLRGYRRPEAWSGETRLAVCERVYCVTGSVGIGIGGGWCERVLRAMGSVMSACWGWDVSILGSHVSTLGVVAAITGKFALGYCTAIVGLCTLGGGVVGGVWLFYVRGVRALWCFPRALIFCFGRGGTVINWEGSYHFWKRSWSYVIAINCESQVIAGAYFREHDNVFIPCSIISACVSVGYVR